MGAADQKKSFLLIAEGSYINILLVLNWFYDFFIKSVKSDQFSTLSPLISRTDFLNHAIFDRL